MSAEVKDAKLEKLATYVAAVAAENPKASSGERQSLRGCRFEKMVRRLHSLRRYGDVRLISNTRRSASKNYVVKKKESRIHFFFCNHLLPLSSLFHVCSLRSVMID